MPHQLIVLYSKFFEICKEQNLFGNLIQLMNEILRLRRGYDHNGKFHT